MLCNWLRPRPLRFPVLLAASLAIGLHAAPAQIQSLPAPTPAPNSGLPSVAAPVPQQKKSKKPAATAPAATAPAAAAPAATAPAAAPETIPPPAIAPSASSPQTQ